MLKAKNLLYRILQWQFLKLSNRHYVLFFRIEIALSNFHSIGALTIEMCTCLALKACRRMNVKRVNAQILIL